MNDSSPEGWNSALNDVGDPPFWKQVLDMNAELRRGVSSAGRISQRTNEHRTGGVRTAVDQHVNNQAPDRDEISSLLTAPPLDRSTLPEVMVQICMPREANVVVPECLRLRYSFQAVTNAASNAALRAMSDLAIGICDEAKRFFDVIDQRYEVFDLTRSTQPGRCTFSENETLADTTTTARADSEKTCDFKAINSGRRSQSDPIVLWLSGDRLYNYETNLRERKNKLEARIKQLEYFITKEALQPAQVWATTNLRLHDVSERSVDECEELVCEKFDIHFWETHEERMSNFKSLDCAKEYGSWFDQQLMPFIFGAKDWTLPNYDFATMRQEIAELSKGRVEIWTDTVEALLQEGHETLEPALAGEMVFVIEPKGHDGTLPSSESMVDCETVKHDH